MFRTLEVAVGSTAVADQATVEGVAFDYQTLDVGVALDTVADQATAVAVAAVPSTVGVHYTPSWFVEGQVVAVAASAFVEVSVA